MDYEKAYKEALERAKEANKSEYRHLKESLEYIFPEVNDSEDERVRNFLIDFIKVCGWTEKKDQSWPLREECIAWLEKQGEQKPQGKTALEAIKEEKVDNANKVEQIPLTKETDGTELIEGDKSSIDATDDVTEKQSDIQTMVSNIIRVLREKEYLDFLGEKINPYNKEIDWLKSLRPLRKKSLTTAVLEKRLCDFQDNFRDTSYEYRVLAEAIEYIRCTEAKKQWKPTKEQMKALSLAVHDAHGNSYWKDLISLNIELENLK